ncbi:hypothetical protein Ddc_18862 [Ditylenchus destructor]|nr:hypothetical protein Ddc_18862 [Ditylenchus destructor]
MLIILISFWIIFSIPNVKSEEVRCSGSFDQSGLYNEETCKGWHNYVACFRPCICDAEIVSQNTEGKNMKEHCGMPALGMLCPGTKEFIPMAKCSSSKSKPPFFTMVFVVLGMYLAHRHGKSK